MQPPKPFTATLESFIDEPVAMGVFAVGSIHPFTSNPLWETSGIYCLLKEDVRAIGASPNLSDTLEARLREDPWFSHGIAIALTVGQWTQAQVTYLEDRLVHMFEVEEFPLEPRAQRDHSAMPQAERLAATRQLLTALRLLEEAGYELFRRVSDGDLQDVTPPTISLEATVKPHSHTALPSPPMPAAKKIAPPKLMKEQFFNPLLDDDDGA